MWKTDDTVRVQTLLLRFVRIIEYPPVRWTLTIIWSLIAVSLMLSSSREGTIVAFISDLFGGKSDSDAVGHVLINTALAFLWCWTISMYVSPETTMSVILIGGIIWGFGAEMTQHFVPERGTSTLDLVANISGVSNGLVVYWVMITSRKHFLKKTSNR